MVKQQEETLVSALVGHFLPKSSTSLKISPFREFVWTTYYFRSMYVYFTFCRRFFLYCTQPLKGSVRMETFSSLTISLLKHHFLLTSTSFPSFLTINRSSTSVQNRIWSWLFEILPHSKYLTFLEESNSLKAKDLAPAHNMRELHYSSLCTRKHPMRNWANDCLLTLRAMMSDDFTLELPSVWHLFCACFQRCIGSNVHQQAANGVLLAVSKNLYLLISCPFVLEKSNSFAFRIIVKYCMMQVKGEG